MNGDSLDEALKREIEEALAVEPSAEFTGRVRRRIANLPAPSRWLPLRRYILGLSMGLTFAALCLIVSQWERAKTPTIATPATPVVAAAILPSPISRTIPVTVSPLRLRRKSQNEPRVLIDPNETTGFQRFLEAITNGQLDVSNLTLGLPKDIVVEPIPTFEPITIAPITPGRLQE